VDTADLRRATGLRLPSLGLGGGPLGNYLVPISDQQAHAVVDTAWEAGVRYFDTAPFYGYGLSERRLGAALRGRPRAEYILSTKVGRLVRPGFADAGIFEVAPTHHCEWDFSRDGVLRSVEESLDRLGLDRVDLLLLHDPDEHWPQALDEAFPVLAELRAQGVVRAIGIGMNQAEMLVRFVRQADPDMLVAANTCTLLRRSAFAELLPLCESRGVAVMAASVFHQGMLATAPGPDAPKQVRLIGETCARHGVPVAAAAIGFPLRHPAVHGVLVGAHSPAHIQADVAALAHDIPDALWAELDELTI
jgi:D-threo-aldose 1-dehydrogenase